MDGPLSEPSIQPVPLPPCPPSASLHQHHSPRRRPDRKFATLIATPAQSPERKRQNAMLDSVKSSHERARIKDKDFIPGVPTYSNRGKQFTVGNISNGLIYLRYHSTLHFHSLFWISRRVYIPAQKTGLSLPQQSGGLGMVNAFVNEVM